MCSFFQNTWKYFVCVFTLFETKRKHFLGVCVFFYFMVKAMSLSSFYKWSDNYEKAIPLLWALFKHMFLYGAIAITKVKFAVILITIKVLDHWHFFPQLCTLKTLWFSVNLSTISKVVLKLPQNGWIAIDKIIIITF